MSHKLEAICRRSFFQTRTKVGFRIQEYQRFKKKLRKNAKSEMSRGYLKYPVAVKGSSTAVRDYYWSEIWSVGYQEHLLGQG